MHYITNIEYLQNQNFEALRPYHIYLTRLAQIKAKLCGRGKNGLGPFTDKDMNEIHAMIRQLEKEGHEHGKLRSVDTDDLARIKELEGYDEHRLHMNPSLYQERQKLKETAGKDKDEHINQLLLGISDIEKLEQLFTIIIETENSSSNGRNYRRNTKINQYIYDMRRVSGLLNGNNSNWDKAFNDLWRFNTYVYGPILFLHKAHLHFARSEQSREMYDVFFKDLIFDSPNFVANSERGKREKALKDRRADYGYKNWFWKFDEYITTLYLNNISHHFEHMAQNFDSENSILKK